MKNKHSAIFTIATTTFTAPLLILCSTLLSTQSASAETVNTKKKAGLQLSITANRRPQSIDKTLASVTVITRKEIENTQTQDIVDLLRQQRGITITRNGGIGNLTSVFIRGTKSGHVLVLLDGVRISSATTSAFDWSQLSLDQIERIEIVRGPRAALYGSDAIGGVIELTTRKNARPYISITAGKYATKKISAGFSDSDDGNHIALNVSKEESDGFSSKKSDSEKDAYDKTNVSLSFSHQVSNKHKVGIDLLHNEISADYDVGHSESELETVNTYLKSDLSDRWSQKLSLSHTKNEVIDTSSYSTYTTNRNELNWQNNIELSSRSSLIVGMNYRKEIGKAHSVDSKSISNKAIYANFNKKVGKLNLDTSIRYDKHSQAGNKATGQIATGYDLSTNITVYASAGTAFKAPNINDLYNGSPDYTKFFAGNPDLKPETSKTFEIGLKTHLSEKHSMEASLFKTKVKNQISNSGGTNSHAVNIGKVSLKGLELGYKGYSNKLNWGVGLSLLRTNDNASNERLIRLPNNKLTLDLGYAISDKTRLGLDASLVSSRDDYAFDPVTFAKSRIKLDSYSLVNLSLNQKLSKHTNLGVRLENVTNEDYELVYGYNTPKRGAYLTFSYK